MRKPTRTLPQEVVLTAGPFVGVCDATAPTTANPAKAFAAYNMVRAIGPAGGGFVSRPGFDLMGTRQGTGSTRVVGGGLTWTKSDATRQTVAVINGQLVTYDWSSDTWTVAVTTANLTTNTVTLSASAYVSLVPFASGLVVSDGVNTPFWWTGASGAGGITKMTNAPVFYGPPWVYYSKLCGIKNSDRKTFVWSEEAQPNTGYEAGGYNNAWDNPGGYADPLVSGAGTNEALYLFRARSSIAITGAIGPDFSTAGTRANLSERIGTLSPYATIALPQGVVIVDSDALPWLVRYGNTEPTPIWTDCRETVKSTPRAVIGTVQSVVDEATRSLLIAIPDTAASDPTQCLAFSLDDLQFQGVHGWLDDMDRVFPVIDGDGVSRYAHAGKNDGYLYAHGTLTAGPWNDALSAGTAYISHQVVGPQLGYDLDRELIVDQIEAALTGGGVTRVSVSYETPRGQSTPLNVDLTASTVGGTWDVDDWDTMDWAESGSGDQRVRMGCMGRGRWVRPTVSHGETGEAFGLAVMRVRTFGVTGNPKSP